MRRLGQAACLAAAFLVAGGHWAVLQSVAWFGMLAEYSGEHGLVAGVSKTFDGQHPCGLCKKVEEGRQQQEESPIPLVKLDKKPDCIAPRAVVPGIIRRVSSVYGPEGGIILCGRDAADLPTPPPRA